MVMTTEAGKGTSSANASASDSDVIDPETVCRNGILLPIWKPDDEFILSQHIVRALIYALLLVYLFIGISVLSDRCGQFCLSRVANWPL